MRLVENLATGIGVDFHVEAAHLSLQRGNFYIAKSDHIDLGQIGRRFGRIGVGGVSCHVVKRYASACCTYPHESGVGWNCIAHHHQRYNNAIHRHRHTGGGDTARVLGCNGESNHLERRGVGLGHAQEQPHARALDDQHAVDHRADGPLHLTGGVQGDPRDLADWNNHADLPAQYHINSLAGRKRDGGAKRKHGLSNVCDAIAIGVDKQRQPCQIEIVSQQVSKNEGIGAGDIAGIGDPIG